MNKIAILAALAAATAFSSPALAGDAEGKWQVKLLGTGVLPDGKITSIDKNTLGLPVGSQTKASDNVVPTIAVEYFATPNFSVETICCLTQHHISGAGAIAGAAVVDHVLILPATVTLKYHLDLGGVKPYLGAGPSVFFYIDEKQGATLNTLNAGGKLHLDNKVGVALQAGVDIPLSKTGMGVSLDAKKYFMNTTLHVFNAGGTEILTTQHKLDPWVLSAGVSYRF